ncbi:hypothetical protein V1504DRAFT_451276 [Lipomyces starkeyi]
MWVDHDGFVLYGLVLLQVGGWTGKVVNIVHAYIIELFLTFYPVSTLIGIITSATCIYSGTGSVPRDL